MRRYPKFSKLYFPGLISLVLLPFLCIGYLYTKGKFVQYYATDIAYVNKANLSAFNKTENDLYKLRNFEEINVGSVSGLNEQTITNLSEKVKSLISKKDTINGFKVNFGKHATYNDFVNVIDLASRSIMEHVRFFLINDDCYIYHYKPTPDKLVSFTCMLNNDLVPINEEPPTMSQMIAGFKQDVMQFNEKVDQATVNPLLFYAALVIWLVMFSLSLFKLKRRHSSVLN